MFSESKQEGGLRKARKESTRRAILAAARDEFEASGFEGVNLRTIARKAGVSAGNILHHFADKRELLHAALFDDLESTLRQALAPEGKEGVERTIFRITRTLFGYYRKRPALSRTLLKESLFAEEPWAGRFREQVTRVHGVVATLVEEAQKRGELEAGLDAPLFALSYLSSYYFALISWVQGGVKDPVPLVEKMVEQQIRGFRSDRKASRKSSAKSKQSAKRGKGGQKP